MINVDNFVSNFPQRSQCLAGVAQPHWQPSLRLIRYTCCCV